MQDVDGCLCQFCTNINKNLFELTPKKIEKQLRNMKLQQQQKKKKKKKKKTLDTNILEN